MRFADRLIVHYSRPRFWLDRDAWEFLGRADDVLVQRIRPSGGTAFTIALTRAELEQVFGDVCHTRSWSAVRCYHFPKLPPAIEAFRVPRVEESPRQVTSAVGATSRPLTTATAAAPTDFTTCSSSEIAQWAADWSNRRGSCTESAGYLESVAAWRNAWRPERVRVLLVAESHVAEADGDTAVRVHVPGKLPAELPDSFCRLVYCLGYGEDALCSPRPTRNRGTRQFWDILGAIAGPASSQPRKSGSSVADRLRWKVEVLTWLREHGVWLVDACVSAVYQSGGDRAIRGRTYDRMLRESFTRFVWLSVRAEPIEQVWLIGAGVAKALHGHPGVTPAGTIVQPQGDRGDPGRHRRELAGLVKEVRSIIPARAGCPTF
jgi:hypothetical protein